MSKEKKPKKKPESKPLSEKDLVDFTLGRRLPVTDAEKEMMKEIEEIKKSGMIVEIPHDFL